MSTQRRKRVSLLYGEPSNIKYERKGSLRFRQMEDPNSKFIPINKYAHWRTTDCMSQFEQTRFVYGPREMPPGGAWPHRHPGMPGEEGKEAKVAGDSLIYPPKGKGTEPAGLRFTSFLWAKDIDKLKPKKNKLPLSEDALTSYQMAQLMCSTRPPDRRLLRGVTQPTEAATTKTKLRLENTKNTPKDSNGGLKGSRIAEQLNLMTTPPHHPARHRMSADLVPATWSSAENPKWFRPTSRQEHQGGGGLGGGYSRRGSGAGLSRPMTQQSTGAPFQASSYIDPSGPYSNGHATERGGLDSAKWHYRQCKFSVHQPSDDFAGNMIGDEGRGGMDHVAGTPHSIKFASSLDYDPGSGSVTLSPRAVTPAYFGGGGSLKQRPAGFNPTTAPSTPFTQTSMTGMTDYIGAPGPIRPWTSEPLGNYKGPVRHLAGYIGPAPQSNCGITPDTLTLSQVTELVPNNTRPSKMMLF